MKKPVFGDFSRFFGDFRRNLTIPAENGRKGVLGPIQARQRPAPVGIDINALQDRENAPISEEILALWDAGIRSAENTGDHVIELYGTIGEDWWTGEGITSKSVSQALRNAGNKDVEVRINSPGGDMFEGISIYNVLASHPANVTVKIMGLAASAASVIAMAGNEIQMGLGSFMMIHNCWIMAMGNRHDMKDLAKWLEPFDNALRDIYIARTGMDIKAVEKWMDEEKMFSAQEAIDNKFADGLLADSAIARDAKASEQHRAFNAARKIEANLCRKAGKTRSQARELIAAMKGMPGAAPSAKPDAGDTWMKEALDFITKLKT